MKGLIEIKEMKYPQPKKFYAELFYRTRTKESMKEMLSKYNIKARNNQIAEIIDQNPAIIDTAIINYRVAQGINYLKSKLNK